MADAIITESANQVTSKRKPPEVDVEVPEVENLPQHSEPWKNVQNNFLPVHFLLLTVDDCEFRSCLSFVKEDFVKSYHKTLGCVYFGSILDNEKVKVAVMKCNMGGAAPGGSLVVVPKAVRILKPKAVFNLGFCASLNKEKAKLGDVVVCSKLITYAFIKQEEDRIEEQGVRVPLNKGLSGIARHIGDGWKPPVKNSTDLKVKPSTNGVFLSGPEVINDPKRLAALMKRFPVATAIEMEGEGLYAAAHDLNIEWIVIKGVSNFADGKKSETDHWRLFASVMAASLVVHILKDSGIFESWPHFEDNSDAEDGSPRKRRRSSSPSGSDPKRKRRRSSSSLSGSDPKRKRRRSSSSLSGSDPKRNKATAGDSFVQGAPQEPSTRRGRRSTRSSGSEPRATQAPVKAGGPPDEELEGLSLKLGEKWKKLGRRLGFDEAEIIGFDQGNRKLAEKAFEMLLNWKQKEGLNASYEVLYDALCHNFVQCKLFAEEFCCDKIVENVSP